jgi:hypothetical protein
MARQLVEHTGKHDLWGVGVEAQGEAHVEGSQPVAHISLSQLEAYS